MAAKKDFQTHYLCDILPQSDANVKQQMMHLRCTAKFGVNSIKTLSPAGMVDSKQIRIARSGTAVINHGMTHEIVIMFFKQFE